MPDQAEAAEMERTQASGRDLAVDGVEREERHPQPGQDRLLDRLGMLEHEPLPIADAGGAQRPLGELARRGPDLPHQERLVHEALGGDLAP